MGFVVELHEPIPEHPHVETVLALWDAAVNATSAAHLLADDYRTDGSVLGYDPYSHYEDMDERLRRIRDAPERWTVSLRDLTLEPSSGRVMAVSVATQGEATTARPSLPDDAQPTVTYVVNDFDGDLLRRTKVVQDLREARRLLTQPGPLP